MLGHLIAIIGLALLCGAWVVFQRWLERVDPDGRHIESGCGGCSGGVHCQTPAMTSGPVSAGGSDDTSRQTDKP